LSVEPDVDDREVIGGNLDAKRAPGRADKADEIARSTATRRGLRQLLDHALLQQPPHDLSDSRRAQTQLTCDVRTRRRAPRAQECQHRGPG
jgi:hypothetical protein